MGTSDWSADDPDEAAPFLPDRLAGICFACPEGMTARLLPRALTIAAALMISTLATVLLSAQANLEPEARVIDDMLIAPCCFSQQVSVHQSEAAEKVRADVRARLAAGETREEILDAYVAMYGQRVLATPPPEGINILLYITPVAVLLSSIGLVFFVVKRFAGRHHDEPTREAVPVSGRLADLEARLDDELGDLD